MEPIEIKQRTPQLMDQLVSLWEASVRATHLFLSEEEIQNIRQYVPQALQEVPHLIIVRQQDGLPAAFMGIADHRLEMLFVLPRLRGKGIGKALLQYGLER